MSSLWAIPTIFQSIDVTQLQLFNLPNTCKHSHHSTTTTSKTMLCQPCTVHAQRGVWREMAPSVNSLTILSLTLLVSARLVEAAAAVGYTTTRSPETNAGTDTGAAIGFLNHIVSLLYFSGLTLLALLFVLFVKAFFATSPGLPLAEKNALHQSFRATPAATRLHDNKLAMAKRLGEAIRFRTVSFDATDAENQIDYTQLVQLHEWLTTTYPLVHKHLERHTINQYSLLYKWKGSEGDEETSSSLPYMVYGHVDVVPVVNQWEHVDDPFSGEIKPDETGKNHVWGRGAIDLKNMCVGWMETLEDLLREGFRPRRTLYLGLGHDEEIGGREGAAHIAKWFQERSITLDFLWDEGLFVIDGVVKGHDAPIAMVCTSEKGFVNVELEVVRPPIHSSFPETLGKETGTPIGILSAACKRLEESPMPGHADGPMRNMFQVLGPSFNWPLKIVMCNMWLLSGLVQKILSGKSKTASLVRSTTALTIFNAGTKANVVPNKARAIINHRIHPKDTIDQVVAHDIRVINDDRVRVRVLSQMKNEASPLSSHDTSAFEDLRDCCHCVYPDAVVAPGLFVAGSDSKHFVDVAKNIYRFNPIRLTNDQTKRFHGLDERIEVDNYCEMVTFMREFVVRTDRR